MARLHFRDIRDWTPASISIVDKPYHPLATFEVFENDDDFIKKYIEPKEVNKMTEESNNNNVVVSGSFFERLLDKIVFKNEPAEPPKEDNPNKEILDKLNEIEENQKAINKRLDAVENPEPPEPTPTPSEGNTGEESNESNENNESTEGNEGNNEPATVELPLNSDGTLDMENSVVAKYLPKNKGGSSQGIDPDLTRTSKPTKSFNERSGRDSNGMSW